jgi:hypothetical protein
LLPGIFRVTGVQFINAKKSAGLWQNANGKSRQVRKHLLFMKQIMAFSFMEEQ